MTAEHSSHYYDTDRNRMLPEQEKARGITDAERAAMTDTKRTVLTGDELTQAVLADQTLQYHFARNGGAGPVSDKGVKIFRAIESAVVAKLRAAGEPVALDRDGLMDLIAEHLSGTYHCTRIWSAWGVGTMSQDDFEDVGESDTPGEIADAIIDRYAAPQASAEAVDPPLLAAESTAAKDGGDAIDLAAALEQQRALKIVQDVRATHPFGASDMPTQGEAAFDMACEEIEHRLRTEPWALNGVPAPLPEDSEKGAGDDFPSDLPGQLREYASNSGYSHQDYADTMREAADALDHQQRAADENDRDAWAADMIAAGAEHLGDGYWEWDVEDFQFRLWQQAMRRQQRGGDVLKGHSSFQEMVGTHVDVWEKAIHYCMSGTSSEADLSYYSHELRALDDIRAALTAHKPGGGDAKDAVPGESALDALINVHQELVEDNPYCYFELAHTRQTGWMAWITDKPLYPVQEVANPDRKVLARGQGDSAEEACRIALAAISAQQRQEGQS